MYDNNGESISEVLKGDTVIDDIDFNCFSIMTQIEGVPTDIRQFNRRMILEG